MAVFALIAVAYGSWLVRASRGASHASLASSNAILVNMLALALAGGLMFALPPAASAAQRALDPELFSIGPLTRLVLSAAYTYALVGMGAASWLAAAWARTRGVAQAQLCLGLGLLAVGLGAGLLLLGVYVPMAQIAGSIE